MRNPDSWIHLVCLLKECIPTRLLLDSGGFGSGAFSFSIFISHILPKAACELECGRTLHHLQLMFCHLSVLMKDASCEARHTTDTYSSYISF